MVTTMVESAARTSRRRVEAAALSATMARSGVSTGVATLGLAQEATAMQAKTLVTKQCRAAGVIIPCGKVSGRTGGRERGGVDGRLQVVAGALLRVVAGAPGD